MSKVAHGGVYVSQTSAEMRLFSENLHVLTSRSWYNFVDTSHWVNQWEIMLETAHNYGLVCQKMRTDTFFKQRTCLIVRSQRAKQWKLSTQTCPRMSKVAHVSQNGAESYRGQSSWSVVLRGGCLYSTVVMHTYLLRHMAGENRGQCLDKCTGGG